MKFSILILFIGFYAFGLAQETPPQKSINWITWQEALKQREAFIKANQEQITAGKLFPKKLFIDVYTSWCGWCKRMDQTTFLDPTIVDYMNANYYPVKLNAEMKDSITYNGMVFFNPNPGGKRSTHTLAASLLDSRLSYPSYVIMDENIMRTVIYKGYMKAEDLLGVLLFYKTNRHLTYKEYVENEFKRKQQAEKSTSK